MIATKNKFCALIIIATFITIVSCKNKRTSTDETPKTDTLNAATIDSKKINLIKGNAGNIYVDDAGTGGIPVLFIHSFGGSTKHWQNQLDHLRGSRRAIALDLRGHGQSDSSKTNDYAIESLADDIAAVVDNLKLDSFVLVGHSMGGSAAISYAAKYPKKVKGLLLDETPIQLPEDVWRPIIASLETNKYDTVMGNYMQQRLTNSKAATNTIEREGMKKLSKAATISLTKAIFVYDPVSDLKKYKGPVLIVSTPTSESQPNSLHKAFPATAFKSVSGTSHWVQLDKPDEFNKILDGFLNTVENKK